MSVIECIFQNCFRIDDDSTHQISPEEFQVPTSPQTLALERGTCSSTNEASDSGNSSSFRQGLASGSTGPGNLNRDIIVTPSNPLSSNDIPSNNDHGFRYVIQNMIQNIENGLFRNTLDPPPLDKNEKISKDIEVHASPLRTATIYKSLDDIPSIALDEVVIPGSMLQKQMSIRLKDKGISSESFVDECVICMEAFDDTNPRMPTLCGCGENKTYFHLPCLYQWVEKCNECPSCREPLNWQEF
jgi:RING-finger-containing ubiquitin ligase